jgi:hypothetical protein
MRAAAHRRFDPRNADRPLVVLGKEDTPSAQVVESVGPLIGPRLRLLELPRHLALELLPEVAQHRLVGLGGAADRQGRVSHPVSR